MFIQASLSGRGPDFTQNPRKQLKTTLQRSGSNPRSESTPPSPVRESINTGGIRMYKHMSPLLKLTIVLRRAIRGTPPHSTDGFWHHRSPSSVNRFWYFFKEKSREVVAIDLLFFRGFVTAWSLDPERFRQKHWIYIWGPKLFLVMMFWSDCYKKWRNRQ